MKKEQFERALHSLEVSIESCKRIAAERKAMGEMVDANYSFGLIAGYEDAIDLIKAAMKGRL